jgi:AcrR family transcriptional regulator
MDMEVGRASSDKATRILDAARRLLLRRGSRGITISEVAKLAKVGNGTVYLYWRTKDDLMVELFIRDYLIVIDEVIATLSREPDKVVPHALLPLIHNTFQAYPFSAAVQMRDEHMLGALEGHPTINAVIDVAGPSAIFAALMPVFRENGIVRTDLSLDGQVYAAAALFEGFFSLPRVYPWSTMRSRPATEADSVMGDVFRLVLEPAIPLQPSIVDRTCRAVLDRFGEARRAVDAIVADLAREPQEREALPRTG